jgi:hypothetical protein
MTDVQHGKIKRLLSICGMGYRITIEGCCILKEAEL